MSHGPDEHAMSFSEYLSSRQAQLINEAVDHVEPVAIGAVLGLLGDSRDE